MIKHIYNLRSLERLTTRSLEANLRYTVNSRPTCITQRDPDILNEAVKKGSKSTIKNPDEAMFS